MFWLCVNLSYQKDHDNTGGILRRHQARDDETQGDMLEEASQATKE